MVTQNHIQFAHLTDARTRLVQLLCFVLRAMVRLPAAVIVELFFSVAIKYPSTLVKKSSCSLAGGLAPLC